MPDTKHRMNIEAIVLDAQTDAVLWTTPWRGATSMSGQVQEFKKNAILICLALAAGVLIVFVLRKDRKQETAFD